MKANRPGYWVPRISPRERRALSLPKAPEWHIVRLSLALTLAFTLGPGRRSSDSSTYNGASLLPPLLVLVCLPAVATPASLTGPGTCALSDCSTALWGPSRVPAAARAPVLGAVSLLSRPILSSFLPSRPPSLSRSPAGVPIVSVPLRPPAPRPARSVPRASCAARRGRRCPGSSPPRPGKGREEWASAPSPSPAPALPGEEGPGR